MVGAGVVVVVLTRFACPVVVGLSQNCCVVISSSHSLSPPPSVVPKYDVVSACVIRSLAVCQVVPPSSCSGGSGVVTVAGVVVLGGAGVLGSARGGATVVVGLGRVRTAGWNG